MTITASNLTINVRDMDKSISFYESIGLQLTNRWGGHYAQLTAPGGLVIGLHPTEADSVCNSGTVSIGFTTNDFDGAKSLLNKMEVEVMERKEAGGKFLHFNDPDGTALYFIQPKW